MDSNFYPQSMSLSGTPGTQTFYDQFPQNIPVAPVDQNFFVPSMGQQMQQPMQPQQNPAFDHVNAVLTQYLQDKQGQQSGNGLTEQILAGRFAPNAGDVGESISTTAQSFLRPDLFKPKSPYAAANERAMNELAPYTTMAELQNKAGTNMMNQSGGGTGVLINRWMQDNPGRSFSDALAAVQAGPALTRQGLQLGPNGQVSVMPGAAQSLQDVRQAEGYGKQQGQNISDLNYKPQIAGGEAQQRQAAELQYAPAIASGRTIGEATGKKEAAIQTRAIQAPQVSMLLGEAKKLLPNATSGGFDTQSRDLMGYMGHATDASKIDSQLDIIGAQLVANVPRMEGPQSDYDVQMYKQAAGDLANPRKPIESRMSALQIMEQLNSKYAGMGQIPAMNQSQLNAPPMGGNPPPPTPGQLQQQMPGGFDLDSYLKEKGLQ